MPIYKTGKKNKEGITQYRVCVNYTDRFGNYKQLQRMAYGSADAKLLEQRLNFELTETVPTKNITVNELYEELVTHKKHDVRQTTLSKFCSISRNNILPYIGNKKLSKLTTVDLQNWKDTIAERDIEIRTKQNAYATLRNILNYAVSMDYIDKNPLSKIGNFRDVNFTGIQDELHYYTVNQFKLFIEKALELCKCEKDYGYYVFFNIAFYTGMRKGEINALKWSDIDGDIIHVRRSISQKLKGGDVETAPKNKSSYRDLQMPKVLAAILKEHKKRQMADEHFSDDFRVCGGPCVLRDSSLSNRNNLFASAAKLPHIKIHDFRHSHASLLANESINIQEIARRLGHSDIKMTWNTYAHLYPREEERAIKILDAI